MADQGRYHRWYEEGNVKYYLEDLELSVQDCKIIILKILEQAVKDYIAFDQSTEEQERIAYQTAQAFLFDPSYTLDWGSPEPITSTHLLELIDIDIDWVREQTRKKFFEEKGYYGKERET
jgi:hypothetical protein